MPFRSGQEPPAHFDLAASSLYFPREPRSWPSSSEVAALNCFADGGTNAHLLIAPAPAGASGGTRAPLPEPALNRRIVIRGTRGTGGAGATEAAPASAGTGAGLFWDSYQPGDT
ncbi:hypothetical protein AB4Z54_75050, partial [Streptomyces sp. MCAF7]